VLAAQVVEHTLEQDLRAHEWSKVFKDKRYDPANHISQGQTDEGSDNEDVRRAQSEFQLQARSRKSGVQEIDSESEEEEEAVRNPSGVRVQTRARTSRAEEEAMEGPRNSSKEVNYVESLASDDEASDEGLASNGDAPDEAVSCGEELYEANNAKAFASDDEASDQALASNDDASDEAVSCDEELGEAPAPASQIKRRVRWVGLFPRYD